MFGYNFTADKARDLSKPFKNIGSLLVSIKNLGSFGFEYFRDDGITGAC